jgi:hypothetical protein
VFRFENDIIQHPDGRFEAVCMSEDWLMSREANARGAKLLATREIKVTHWGQAEFPNSQAWGSRERDETRKDVVHPMDKRPAEKPAG